MNWKVPNDILRLTTDFEFILILGSALKIETWFAETLYLDTFRILSMLVGRGA